MPSQDRTATHVKPYQDQRGDHIGQRRAQGGTLHTKAGTPQRDIHAQHADGARREDQQEVEDHVKYTRQHGDGARPTHVAARLEHGRREVLHHEERSGQRKDEEINRGIVLDVAAATQPPGQRTGDTTGYGHEHQRENKAKQIAVLHHPTGLPKIVRPYEVSHLYGKTHRRGTRQRAEEP